MDAGKSLCILILEDHQNTLEVIARLLRGKGHTVYTARTAEEAKHLAATNHCDLLISDIGLPGSSGIELMRELREQHGLKGIAFSGYTAGHDAGDPLAAEFDKPPPQPTSFAGLMAAIEELTS